MTKILLICWPVFVIIFALLYKNKKADAVSLPKAFWFAYTTSTWFFLPLIFIFNHGVALPLKIIIGFHLLSWWIRGVVQLVMSSKWQPRYGIIHDVFHLLGLLLLYFVNRSGFLHHHLTGINSIVIAFLCITIFATVAESSFAYLSMNKTEIDEQKLIFINRMTIVVVCAVMSHLICQSLYAYLAL